MYFRDWIVTYIYEYLRKGLLKFMDNHPNTSGYIFLINESLYCVELSSFVILLFQNESGWYRTRLDCSRQWQIRLTAWIQSISKIEQYIEIIPTVSVNPAPSNSCKVDDSCFYVLIQDCLAYRFIFFFWSLSLSVARPCFRIVTYKIYCGELNRQVSFFLWLKQCKMVPSSSGIRFVFSRMRRRLCHV